MSSVRIYKIRLALNAARARLDEIERLLNEHEGVARVVKKAKKAKRKPAANRSRQIDLEELLPKRARAGKKAKRTPAKRRAPAKGR